MVNFRIGVVVSGVVWGSASFLLFPANDPEHQMFLIFMLAGLTAGGVASYSADLASVIGFSISTLVPLAARMFAAGGSLSMAMGMAITLYLGFMIMSGRKSNQHIRDNIVLRLEASSREDAIRASEEQYRLLLRHSPVGIFHYDTNLVITYCNDRFADILESSVDRIVGMDMKTLRDQSVLPPLRKALNGEMAVYEGHYLATFSDANGWIDMTCAPSRDSNDRVVGGIAIVQDITEKKSDEQALLTEIEKNKVLFKTAGDGLHIMDVHGNLLQASDSFCRMLGYSQDEVLGMNVLQWDALLPPETLFEDVVNRIPEKGILFETRQKCKDGHLIDVEIFSNALTIQGTRYVYASSRDITERNQVEQALKKSKDQLAAILNSTTESIFHVDGNGIILAMNDIAAHRAQNEPRDMIGKCAFDFFPPEVADSRRENLLEVFRTGQEKYTEDARNDHFFSISYYPIDNNDGKVESVVVYAADITDRKKASNTLRESEEKLRGLYELSPLGIALTDMTGRYIEFNEAFQKICGYSRDELNALDYWALTPKKYEADEMRQLQSLQETGHYGPYEKEYIRKDGNLIPILLNGLLITGIDGNKYIWSIVEDISVRQRMMVDLRESEERFRQMFERHSAVMLLIEPLSGMIVDANPAAASFYGYPLIYLRGKALSSINLQTETQISDEMQQAVVEERNYFIFNHRLANGDIRTVEVHSSPVNFKNKSLLFAIIHDITDRKLAEEQIRHLAYYDTLTKVPNRRLLNDRLDQTIVASKRNSRYGALMFLDLDNFKPLNDLHGHKAGDSLLIEAARRISSCIRETDTVARFGGDEFVVMLSELNEDRSESTAQASNVAEKIRTSMSEPYRLTVLQDDDAEITVEHHCTSSIGVVVFNHQFSREDILKWADMAMYDAKKAGRNCVVFNQQSGSKTSADRQSPTILHLNWHASYDCGESTIDDEHRKLFEIANQLIDSAFTRDEDPLKFDSELERLLAHVVHHFADEEAILERLHYSDLDSHVHAHKILVEHAAQLRDTALAGGVTIGELVDFLAEEVVAQHMLKTDRKFYPLFDKG